MTRDVGRIWHGVEALVIPVAVVAATIYFNLALFRKRFRNARKMVEAKTGLRSHGFAVEDSPGLAVETFREVLEGLGRFACCVVLELRLELGEEMELTPGWRGLAEGVYCAELGAAREDLVRVWEALGNRAEMFKDWPVMVFVVGPAGITGSERGGAELAEEVAVRFAAERKRLRQREFMFYVVAMAAGSAGRDVMVAGIGGTGALDYCAAEGSRLPVAEIVRELARLEFEGKNYGEALRELGVGAG